MTTWKSSTKATPANIRKRVSAAQAAIDGAIDLVKKRAREDKLTDAQMRRLLTPLCNSYAWLTDVQRRLNK